MRHLLDCFALAPFLVLAACSSPKDGEGSVMDGGGGAAPAGSVEVYQTARAGGHFSDVGSLPVSASAPAGRSTIAVSGTKLQSIIGFGGALTELAAYVLSTLPAAARTAALDAYFSTEGSGYTLARTHIASCDFSLASYQFSTTASPTIADFSVSHDEALLIPLIKDATTASAGALKVLASPWSAPAWMKDPPALYVPPTAANNYAGTDPILEPQYFGTYALYLEKYIQAYQAEGINIWAITPQNEPLGNGGQWETMAWTNVTMNNFLKDNLGPLFKADGIDVKVFVYDHNKGAVDSDYVDWARTIYTDPTTSPFVYGSATHWYGSTIDVFQASLQATHALDPDKVILATEGCLDGLSNQEAQPPTAAYKYSWLSDDFYWTKDEYDWGYWYATGAAKALHPVYEPVYRYARDIIVGLNNWYVGWIDWNTALDLDGGPNHVSNFTGAGMLINTTTESVSGVDPGSIYYTPVFYTMRHFSKYIRPGAVILQSSVTLAPGVSTVGYDGQPTDGLLSVTAKNTDGSTVTVVFNETAAPIDYTVSYSGENVNGTAPAESLQTLVWTGGP